jgi:hypothetical protein
LHGVASDRKHVRGSPFPWHKIEPAQTSNSFAPESVAIPVAVSMLPDEAAAAPARLPDGVCRAGDRRKSTHKRHPIQQRFDGSYLAGTAIQPVN